MWHWISSLVDGTVPDNTILKRREDLLQQHSAEIAARLLRKAELMREGNVQHKLDAELLEAAADHMRKSVLDGASEWLDRRDLCLRLLREGKN